jgi:hypothetical protein
MIYLPILLLNTVFGLWFQPNHWVPLVSIPIVLFIFMNSRSLWMWLMVLTLSAVWLPTAGWLAMLIFVLGFLLTYIHVVWGHIPSSLRHSTDIAIRTFSLGGLVVVGMVAMIFAPKAQGGISFAGTMVLLFIFLVSVAVILRSISKSGQTK